ncbi:MAG: glycosyltransferase [Candidatus Sulfopaludibacter sp.]|nr:glycosyltransferase [Candidatus Sulfopaludibacter sp.]
MTIPNGIDAATFCLRDKTASRSRLGIPAARRLIVSAGHLIRGKGHQHVIRAVRSLVDRGADVDLRIAGDAGRLEPCEQELRLLVVELGIQERVTFLGRLAPPDLSQWLSAADLFCLASGREGWPNVVNEAVACGTPVVATAVGGVPQMIPNRQYGLTIPPESVHSLNGPLAQALEMQWDRHARAAWGMSPS